METLGLRSLRLQLDDGQIGHHLIREGLPTIDERPDAEFLMLVPEVWRPSGRPERPSAA
jgi:hypothetical protein